MAGDKNKLQRKLLRTCYKDLDRRTKDDESGCRIIFENGFPKVVVTTPINKGANQRSTVNRS